MFEASCGFLPKCIFLLLPTNERTLFFLDGFKNLLHILSLLLFILLLYAYVSLNNNIFSFDFWNILWMQFVLILHHIKFLMLILMDVCSSIHTISMLCTMLWTYDNLSILWSVNIYVVFSFFFFYQNSASISILSHISWCMCARIPLRNGVAGS